MSDNMSSLQEIYDKIMAADMLLVGLGEEFNGAAALKSLPGYDVKLAELECTGDAHLIPAYQRMFNTEYDAKVKSVLTAFADMIRKKNHFIVSTSHNDVIREIPWREERLVMPCGGSVMKQCSAGCEDSIVSVSAEEKEAIRTYLAEGISKTISDDSGDVNLDENNSADPCEKCADVEANDGNSQNILGVCPVCGAPMVLNNVYAENYSEKGYLADWQIYTKWLGGSLARNIVILELGVGLKYPSVIRWPFEKIAFYQEKSSFYRVHETLYQMSPELKERGHSYEMSALAFLEELCKLSV